MQQDVRRICSRVRVAQVQPEVRADPMSLETDAIGPIRQQRARQPVVRPLDDLLRGRVITAMKVEDMVWIGRRPQRGARGEVRILVPNRADDYKRMTLYLSGVS